MEHNQPDQTLGRPQSDIVLPDDWNTKPRRGPASSSRCSLCQWNGYSRDLLAQPMVTVGKRISDFRTSGINGCPSCAICAKILEYVGIPEQWKDWVHVSKHPNSPHIRVSWNPPSSKSSVQVDLSMYLPKNKDYTSTPNAILTESLLAGNTASLETLQWAKLKLSECLSSHTQCRSSGSPGFLPTRMICVQSPSDDDKDVLLVNKEDVPAGSAYVALSHCWGKKLIHCITTRATLADRMQCIPWSTLTHTFQDAVTFTRGLGIQYLWIDSICIIQKDADDWEKESTKMLSVYENAQVTIAGVYAGDSSGGLFSQLKQGRQRQVANLLHLGEKYPLYLRQSHRFFHDWRTKHLSDTSPLFTRAWTFQERLVAPRVLFFTEYELLWECFTSVDCECGRGLVGWADADDEDMWLREPILPKKEFGDFILDFENLKAKDGTSLEKETLLVWHSQVARYSKFDLTVPTDKLPGIAAIAEMIQRRRPGEQYFAGLWSTSLIEDLHWRTDRVHHYLPRPKPATAPTWSWASVGGAVLFDEINRGGIDRLIEVVDVRCEHTEAGAFGQVQTGRLVLRGRSLPCRIIGRYPTRICTATPDADVIEDDSHSIFPDCADLHQEKDESIQQEALLLETTCSFQPQNLWSSRYNFLILSPNNCSSGTYSRIGCMSTSTEFMRSERYKLFEGSCETKEYTII